MPRRLVRLPASAAPLLDVVSYARPGPGRRDRIPAGEREHITRTVRRAPEVMVKVLSKGGQDLRAIRRHLDYLRFRDDGELARFEGALADDAERGEPLQPVRLRERIATR